MAALQPNIDPFTEKFDELSPDEQLKILLHLSDSIASKTTQYIIGPETCLPEITEDNTLAINSFIKP